MTIAKRGAQAMLRRALALRAVPGGAAGADRAEAAGEGAFGTFDAEGPLLSPAG